MSNPHPTLALEQEAAALPGLVLDAAGLAALELLLEGAFTPLAGFRLTPGADGTPALPLHHDAGAAPAQPGVRFALQDSEGVTLGLLDVESTHDGDGVCAVAGPVRGIRRPARELFQRDRVPVAAIRTALAASGRASALCVSLRGVPDAAARERIASAAGDDAVLLRVMDCGDADRAHQVRQRLEAARAVAASLGEGRCVVSVCPDPHPLPGPQRTALDALYARNAGCARSEHVDGEHAPGAPSPYVHDLHQHHSLRNFPEK